ncbi:hypothetical protein [Planomicrobium sp. YIM 101495]|uniref:hypothetical protein n=1 Tax=Planomicrobium sp. YIM 101495 TaxID=2665160 RepID=UPI0012BA27C7|nr:hypothetical protein [Planomicrobium sp. YIM 101495]MTD30687.1 hypothetical protein [Planomicrobium sp. YIM 101495]
MEEKKHAYYDVWGDNVELKDLTFSLVLSIAGTLGGYLLAPNEEPMPLVFGLVGGVIAFAISSIFIKPKRLVKMDKEEVGE